MGKIPGISEQAKAWDCYRARENKERGERKGDGQADFYSSPRSVDLT